LKKAVQNIFDVISTKRIWIENILLYVVVVVVVVAFDVGAVASATLDFYGKINHYFQHYCHWARIKMYGQEFGLPIRKILKKLVFCIFL